jgi:hypothetical protein
MKLYLGYCAVRDISEDRAQSVLWGNLRERDNLEDTDVDGRVILKCIFQNRDRGMGWIDLAEDRGRWGALVSAVMNLRFPHNVWSYLTS